MIVSKFDDLVLVWKPGKVASTQGEKENVVDAIVADDAGFFDSIIPEKIVEQFGGFNNSFAHILTGEFKKYENSYQHIPAKDFLVLQKEVFGLEEEFGLLNRLDFATAGWLYFAGSQVIYKNWSVWQEKKKIEKVYYAVVEGNIENYFVYGAKKKQGVTLDETTIMVERPLMHHKGDARKMLVIVDDAQKSKGRGAVQEAYSEITPCAYDEEKDCSLIRVVIYAGKRHQIRAHCASLGHPVVGDRRYNDNYDKDADCDLALWSMGVDRVEESDIDLHHAS